MSRKPVHIEAAERGGKPYGRQAMWAMMRAMDSFSVENVALVCLRDVSSVRTYLQRLIAAGIVADTGEVVVNVSRRNSRHKLYKVVNDMGHEAPRLKADGTPLVAARDQMWLTMKILSSFTHADLAAHAATEECPVTAVDAQDYCKHLHKAGYLAVIKAATPTSKAVYKLLPRMNTGPHAPMVQRTKVVFDPNRNRIMWHEEIEP